MTSGRSLSLLAIIAALALAVAIALSIPSTANADGDHSFGGSCVRITMVSADADYTLHLVNQNRTKLGLNNREVGSSIILTQAPERIGILIDHTGDVKWDHRHLDNGQIGFEDHDDGDFNDAVIRVEPASCPSRISNPAPTHSPTAAALEVSFDDATYSVNEGSSVTVTVDVSPDADRNLEVPVSISDDAETGDYEVSGLTGGKLSFTSGDSSASFTISTVDDADRDDETLNLAFGELPDAVSEGTQAAAQVAIEDITPAPRSNRRSARSDGGSGGGSGGNYYSRVAATVNLPPEFIEGANAQRLVPENVANPSNVGSPVTALDPDGDILTYNLGGPDAASYSLDSGNGQLKTAIGLDYEIRSTYHVILYVFDAKGGRDSIVVTIRLTDVAEQEVVIKTPAPTPRPDPTATPRPDPTAMPRPNPTATAAPDPTSTPAPIPTAALWPLQFQWPASTSTPVALPTATRKPTPPGEPATTPEPSTDSQAAMLVDLQGGDPLGDYYSTNFRSTVTLLPEEQPRHLLIWPIVLEALGVAMMVVSVGMFKSGSSQSTEIGNRDFIMNSKV